MRDKREMFLQRSRYIALHHLHVVNVILNEEIFRSDIGDDLDGLLCPAQENARNIQRVDRLNQQANIFLRKRICSEPQILPKHLVQLKHICTGRRDTDETIHLTAIESLCIIDGAEHAIAEFIDPIRENRDSPLAGPPITRREVVQYLRKSMLQQLLAQQVLFKIIGEQIFDAAEAGSFGRGEAVKEWQFVEEHGEIGSKFWHDQMSSCGSATAVHQSGWKRLRQTGRSSARRVASRIMSASSTGKSRVSSNSTILSISVPIAMLVTRSRMNSTTTGTLCCVINSRAVANAACASFGSMTRMALQPRPSATAT